MKVPYNDLSRQHNPEDYLHLFAECIKNNTFVGDREFAQEFATFTGSKYCLSCANGTDALTISIMALELKPQSRIAVPAISYAATAAAVVEAGHIPFFIDIDEETGLMDLEKLKHHDVDCVIPVHLYGQCVDITKIDPSIPIIEDCAQAHDATINGKHVGTFGRFGCFSFYPGKNLGAFGDAGCIITQDEGLFKRIQMIASLGATRTDKYLHEIHGINSRMDTIQGLVLKHKLKTLHSDTNTRIQIAERYDSVGCGLKRSNVGRDVYHCYVIKVKNREKAIRYFTKDCNIQINLHYPYALSALPCFEKFQHCPCPNALRFCSQCLSIPLFPTMKDDEINYVVNCLEKFSE